MQQVNAAKEILTDPKKREVYDRYGLEGMKQQTGDGGSPFSGFPGGSKLIKKKKRLSQ